ncbi:hypothetical protein ABID21_003194 [Pseudorhizobium tarimense]|uniref:Uncharacterized protein n=1 Tax=Pseudorhizobium tarimense TaxID=1079109 RepID=A0ABV2H9F1_9HYPH|nr:hypothetical protein [Pseudorhizobium tarimense]MCJ8520293.1 hypothetical protein [Pseudorhizobium tarimense]
MPMQLLGAAVLGRRQCIRWRFERRQCQRQFGGGGGSLADVDASIGGSNGINAGVNANTRDGLDAGVTASIGGSAGSNTGVGVGIGGGTPVGRERRTGRWRSRRGW